MFFKGQFYRTFSLCMLLFFFSGSFVFGSESAPKITNANYAGNPHCGLYCLYSILKMEGQTIDYRELVKPNYLGSKDGSSFEELKQAGEDFGLNVISINRLIPGDLRTITEPVILHVKSRPDKKDYDHFVLYLGEKDGKAEIFDPPAELYLVEFSSLSPKWDGNALVFSSKPIAANSLSTLLKKRLFFFFGVIGLVVAAFYGLKQFIPVAKSTRLQFGLSVTQGVGLALIAVFSGLLFHFFYGGGFFANASAIEGIQKAYTGSFIAKITPRKMQQIVTGNNAIIVDARLERDYKSGHIEGAINVPVNCSDEVYTERISELTKDKKIVLYCQSAGCQYAEKVALRLKADGFDDLAIFKGGWVEWEKVTELQSAKTENKNEKNI